MPPRDVSGERDEVRDSRVFVREMPSTIHWSAISGSPRPTRDVVVDRRGIKPLDPEEVLADREVADFDREDIGYLTKPVDMPKWISQVQTRFPFLRDLTPNELRWCACNARDRYEVEQILSDLSSDPVGGTRYDARDVRSAVAAGVSFRPRT